MYAGLPPCIASCVINVPDPSEHETGLMLGQRRIRWANIEQLLNRPSKNAGLIQNRFTSIYSGFWDAGFSL